MILDTSILRTENQRFPIGTKFLSSGKHPRLCTVTNFCIVLNTNDTVIKSYYIADHDFCGQTVTEDNLCETTIARGVFRLNEANK